MARNARIKVRDNEAWYHLYAKSSGTKDDFPFNEPGATKKMIEIIKHFTSVYCCDIACYCIMGNHYHLVVRFEKPGKLNKKILKE